nr:immunoglobulin light chain junction region [Macaca mulatta]
CQNYVRFSYSF